MFDSLIGLCFLLSSLCLVAWLYSRAAAAQALPAFMRPLTLSQLATRKLIIVLLVSCSTWLLLLWTLLVAAIYTPFVSSIAASWLYPAVFITAIASPLVALVGLVFRGRILETWFPFLLCPDCRQEIALKGRWQCPGGCPVGSPRHVLTSCPTCGTAYHGISCTGAQCQELIAFNDQYHEFEVNNRGKKYVTRTNARFYIALSGLDIFAMTTYACLQNGLTIPAYAGGALAVASGLCLVVFRPKRLLRNPYFLDEEESKWPKTATV